MTKLTSVAFTIAVTLASLAQAKGLCNGRLEPGKGGVSTATLQAGRGYIIRITGDSDGDLDCAVASPAGDVVSSDTDNEDSCFMVFTAPQTGTYRIVMKNNGSEVTYFVGSIHEQVRT